MTMMVVPQAAIETGLIPKHKDLVSDDPEPQIDLSALDFSEPVVREAEEYWIDFSTMIKRARDLKAYGSLGFARILIDLAAADNAAEAAARAVGKKSRRKIDDIFPSWCHVLLPRTIFRYQFHERTLCAPILYRSGDGLEVSYSWIGGESRYGKDYGLRFVRPALTSR